MLIQLTVAILKGWFKISVKKTIVSLWAVFMFLPIMLLFVMYTFHLLAEYQEARIRSFFSASGEGAFKLLAGTKEEGYGGYCFFAPVEWANPCENHVLEKLRKGGDDWKWKVPAAGTYTLVIDLSAMTISLNPVK